MAIIVIGGQSRSVGKTSVVAGLIAALRVYGWTAFKITQYGHGICSQDGAACDCATADHAWAVSQEHDVSGESDTSRFLLAGAERSWWVRTQQGRLAEAMPMIRRRLAETGNAIFESNSIVKFIRPDLYLTVLDPATADFKKSAQELLDRADGVVLHRNECDKTAFAWESASLKSTTGKPIFSVRPPEYITQEIVEFVTAALQTRCADHPVLSAAHLTK